MLHQKLKTLLNMKQKNFFKISSLKNGGSIYIYINNIIYILLFLKTKNQIYFKYKIYV